MVDVGGSMEWGKPKASQVAEASKLAGLYILELAVSDRFFLYVLVLQEVG